MKVDTATAVSIIARGALSERRPKPASKIQSCKTQLGNYSGDKIPVIGQVEVEVKVEARRKPNVKSKFPLVVVEGLGEC